MKSAEIKKELHKYIDEADIAFLNILHDVVAEYSKSKKAGPTAIEPMTKEAYIGMIKKAGKEIKAGEIHSEEEVSAHLKKKYADQL